MSNFVSDPEWTPEALALLQKTPFFVRARARQQIEQAARDHDHDLITAEFVETIRAESGQ